MSRTKKDKVRALIKKDPTNHMWNWEYGYGLCYGGVSSKFKKIRRRKRRAKEKAALRANRQLPKFKKSDEWDWF